METRLLWHETGWRNSTVRIVIIGLALGLLVGMTGCQSAQAGSAAAATATQPPATMRPPTATPEPTATSTPEPPTATPEPSPTSTPTRVPTPEVVTIPYMDLETETNPAAMPQWLKIYRPADVAGPYPVVFLLPEIITNEATDYRGVVKEFMARGYAVVLVKHQDPVEAGDDLSLRDSDLSGNAAWTACALAWTTAFGGDYDLDLTRLVIFSHSAEGPSAARMPLYDEEMWADALADCGYPAPEPGAVRGVVTFDAVLGMPDANLRKFQGKFAQAWGIPADDMPAMVDALNATPPESWHQPGVLDEATRNRLAKMLPLYWVYAERAEDTATPSYLFIYDREGKDIFDPVAEAEGMAPHMRAAGIDVALEVMRNLNGGWELTESSTDVAERVVDAADAWIRDLLQ